MNELERTALNEILRTVTYIAEKLDEVDSKISLNDSQVLEHQEQSIDIQEIEWQLLESFSDLVNLCRCVFGCSEFHRFQSTQWLERVVVKLGHQYNL